MKKLISKLTSMGALAAPMFFSGCSWFGVYSERQALDLAEEFKDVGFDEGRHAEIRKAEEERQKKLGDRQTDRSYYWIPTPEHINEDGVLIETHRKLTEIITDK